MALLTRVRSLERAALDRVPRVESGACRECAGGMLFFIDRDEADGDGPPRCRACGEQASPGAKVIVGVRRGCI